MSAPTLNAEPIGQTRFGNKNMTAIKWGLWFAGSAFLLIAIAFETRFYGTVIHQLRSVGWSAALQHPKGDLVFFTACLKNTNCRTDAIFANFPLSPTLGLIALGLSVFGFFIGTLLAGLERDRWTNKPPGLARWANRPEMDVWVDSEKNPKVGYVGLTKSGAVLRLVRRERNRGVPIVGGPGAGKTKGVMLPNIIQDVKDNASVIIIDIKYPDTGLFDAVGWFHRAGMPP